MDKQAIYNFLDSHGIRYEAVEHAAVRNMAELAAAALPHAEAIAKNLFVRDEKRQGYYLISMKGEKRINLKCFGRENGIRRLTFADDKEMQEILNLAPGSVTPLGLLNDDGRKVCLFLDKAFLDSPSLIGVHPNENTATVWLRAEDLVRIIREHGNEVRIMEIS